jgi:predicted hydrocarbon binding protein
MTSYHNNLVGVSPGVLHRLRQSLETVLGDQAAALLQEVGFSSGADVYAEFAMWLNVETDVMDPREVDAEHLGGLLSRFFAEAGWGELALERMGAATMCMTAKGWAESSPQGEGDLPSCHLTTGILASMLGKLADDVVAVMEVDCRTRGDDACRFLIGAPETLQVVFEGMSQGTDYEELLTTTS